MTDTFGTDLEETLEEERVAQGDIGAAVANLVDAVAAKRWMWGMGDGYGGHILATLYAQLDGAGIPVDYPHFTPPDRVQRLALRDGWECAYCGAALGWGNSLVTPPEIEHVIPRSRGGSNYLANLVLACRPCNRAKGTMTADEFMASQL